MRSNAATFLLAVTLLLAACGFAVLVATGDHASTPSLDRTIAGAHVAPDVLPAGPASPVEAAARVALPAAPVLEGRLVLPSGAAHDPTLRVVLVGDRRQGRYDGIGGRSWHRRDELGEAPVAGDGSFSIELPAETDADLAVDVDGLHLHLADPMPVDSLKQLIEIEPVLGGAIRGRLAPPGGSDDAPTTSDVACFGRGATGGMWRAVTLEETLEFELRGLMPDIAYEVTASTDRHPSTSSDREWTVEAGRTVTMELALDAGATVRGRIVDAQGEPVPGAEVKGLTGSTFVTRPHGGIARSAADGSFELSGLAATAQRIEAWAEGFLEGESQELDLEDGVGRDGVVIALGAGLAIAGRVVRPDGTPSANTRLVLAPQEVEGDMGRLYELARAEGGAARTAEDGSFRIDGLNPGTYAMFADERDPSDRAQRWNARATSIAAGTLDLRLELAPVESIDGNVLDDAGGPVESFTIEAKRVDWPVWVGGPSSQVDAEFVDGEGRYSLAGLDAGAWRVSVRATGHLPVWDREILVPAAEIEPFELTRTARLAGTVTDPSGRPIEGAEVRARAQSDDGRSGSARTDADGCYALDEVGPGPVAVEATVEEWAPSETTLVELAPGEHRTDVGLRLSEGGAIAGLVLDPDGTPAAGRAIGVQWMRGDAIEVVSDENGRFTAEGLAPGPYQVIAMPAVEDLAEPGAHTDLGEIFEDLAMAVVEVELGRTTEVLLGEQSGSSVLVSGRVLRAGIGVAGAELIAVREDGSLFEGMRADTTGDDGRFELTLDAGGDCTFVVTTSAEAEPDVDFQIAIPETSSFEVDLELPAGSIEGTVIGPDGARVDRGVVWIKREDGTSDLSGVMGRGSASIASDGSFTFTALHAGRYSLSATSAGSAVVTRNGVEVPDAGSSTTVDLQLGRAGSVHGKVVDAGGSPVFGARILAWSGDGESLGLLGATSDHAGAFAIDAVPVGAAFIAARTNDGRATQPARVHVEEEGVAEVALKLEAGALLAISAVDGSGVPLRIAVRVECANGPEFAGAVRRDDLQRLALTGLRPRERRVGPLPAGSYTVRATTAGGLTGTASVVVDGTESEIEVAIELDESMDAE
ncbi:MAG: carboxypeptidase regulatory-like domain-containing protein [Planctomycetota bacterium]